MGPPAAGAEDWFLLIFTVTPRYQVSGGYHSFHPSVGGSPTRRGSIGVIGRYTNLRDVYNCLGGLFINKSDGETYRDNV